MTLKTYWKYKKNKKYKKYKKIYKTHKILKDKQEYVVMMTNNAIDLKCTFLAIIAA